MSECDFMRESMPSLLTESLDPVRREQTHLHIERCPACNSDWTQYRETWQLLEALPEVEVPSRVRDRFLSAAGITAPPANVVPIRRRLPVRWLAEAAAVVLVAGGAYYAGNNRAPVRLTPTPATIASATPYSIAESRVLPASAISPNIQGRPAIENVTFVDENPNDDAINVSFDMTQHVTVTGKPTDKSMVRLMRYVLENEDHLTQNRSRTIDWVRSAYSRPGVVDPEIAEALANVVRNETHEGVRIKALDTLKTLPAPIAQDTRAAFIEALRNDPNPAVRMKAVDALANMARNGATFDSATLDILRQKAAQDDENVYVRVKAAEVLSSVRP